MYLLCVFYLWMDNLRRLNPSLNLLTLIFLQRVNMWAKLRDTTICWRKGVDVFCLIWGLWAVTRTSIYISRFWYAWFIFALWWWMQFQNQRGSAIDSPHVRLWQDDVLISSIFKAAFGEYIEATVDTDVTNDMKGCTHAFISLGSSGNWQGFQVCFDLKMLKCFLDSQSRGCLCRQE